MITTNDFFQKMKVWRVLFIVMPVVYFSVWLVMSIVFISDEIVMVLPSLLMLVIGVFIISTFTLHYSLVMNCKAKTHAINKVILKKLMLSLILYITISSVSLAWGAISFAIASAFAMFMSGIAFALSYKSDFELIVPGGLDSISRTNKTIKASDNHHHVYSFKKNNNSIPVTFDEYAVISGDDISLRQPDYDKKEYVYEVTSDSLAFENYGHHEQINPGSGLPMINDNIDIRGNPYGSNSLD